MALLKNKVEFYLVPEPPEALMNTAGLKAIHHVSMGLQGSSKSR